MNKIYYLKIVNDIEEYNINSTNNHPIYEELSNCLDIADIQYLEFTNDDDIFVRLPNYKIDKIITTLSKYFKYTMSDVTDAVISGELERKFPESYKLFNNFRLDNTSLDNILDKINNGIVPFSYRYMVPNNSYKSKKYEAIQNDKSEKGLLKQKYLKEYTEMLLKEYPERPYMLPAVRKHEDEQTSSKWKTIGLALGITGAIASGGGMPFSLTVFAWIFFRF